MGRCRVCDRGFAAKFRDNLCEDCADKIEVWRIFDNGSIRKLSEQRAQELSTCENKDKITGIFVMKYLYRKDCKPEIWHFENSEYISNYFPFTVKQLKSVIEVLKKPIKIGGN